MARVGGMPLPTITDDRVLGESVIQRSLRFNGSSHYLERTPSGAGNRKTWTWSAWIKRGSLGSRQILFSADDNATNATYFILELQSDDNLRCLAGQETASATCVKETAAVIRDTTNWYHLVFKFDAANTSAVWYINGQEITDLNSSTDPSNQDFQVNATTQHFLGRFGSSLGTSYFDGYMAEVNFVDGYAYDASYFGFTDSQTGIWMPRRYEETYGTNGFRLDFLDNSSAAALGIDKSPNGNDFTTNNFSVAAGSGNDSFIDTPTNNFCTLNPLDKTNDADVQNGGLTLYNNANDQAATGTFGVTSGKWYWEITMNSNEPEIGIAHFKMPLSNKSVSVAGDGQIALIVTGADGNSNFLRVNGSTTSGSGISGQSGPGTIGIALDMDNKKIWFTNTSGNYFNSGNPVTGNNPAVDFSSTGHYPAGVTPFVSLYQGANIQTSINFGQRSFAYTAPEGYKTLSSQNLRDHLITSNTPILNPKEHFAAITYSGAQSSTNATGLLFEPDMIWIKSRTQLYNHYIFDRLRGLDGSHLIPNSTSAEGPSGSDATALGGTHASGFFVSSASGISDSYQAPNNYIAWCWKAGGAAVTNTDGSITSQVSVNQEAGFSIVTWTGTGADGTVGHGLGKKPAWIIVKNRDSAQHWSVKHKDLTSGYNVKLNLTEAEGQSTGSTNGIIADLSSSSNFSLTRTGNTGNYKNVNLSGEEHVAYCWAEIPGYSKFGSYEGNNNSNGTYVPLGFRPAWVMIKNIDAGSTEWYILDAARDTDNPVGQYLSSSSNAVEATYIFYDFLSDGFKLRNTGSAQNPSSQTIIYMAFAEQSGISPYSTIRNAR